MTPHSLGVQFWGVAETPLFSGCNSTGLISYMPSCSPGDIAPGSTNSGAPGSIFPPLPLGSCWQ